MGATPNIPPPPDGSSIVPVGDVPPPPDASGVTANTQATMSADTGGTITNDVGNQVIVPKEGETFADTMQRAATKGKNVTQDQIDKEMATAPKKAAQVLGAAATAGFAGPAALGVAGSAVGAAGSAVLDTALDSLPHITKAVQAFGEWAEENPRAAKIIIEFLKGGAYTGGSIAAIKKWF